VQFTRRVGLNGCGLCRQSKHQRLQLPVRPRPTALWGLAILVHAILAAARASFVRCEIASRSFCATSVRRNLRSIGRSWCRSNRELRQRHRFRHYRLRLDFGQGVGTFDVAAGTTTNAVWSGTSGGFASPFGTPSGIGELSGPVDGGHGGIDVARPATYTDVSAAPGPIPGSGLLSYLALGCSALGLAARRGGGIGRPAPNQLLFLTVHFMFAICSLLDPTKVDQHEEPSGLEDRIVGR
jgi:hypothetical protein